MTDDFMRMMAAWALVHETADEGWKAAVRRGLEQGDGEMADGPEAFVDALSAMIAEEKDRLKTELASDDPAPEPGTRGDVSSKLDDLSFEVGELRGRLESMQASLDAIIGEPEDG